MSKGCSTASRRVRMASGLASSRSLRKTKGKDYGLTERKQNTNDLRIGVYITSVPASEGLWSSVRNVETTLIEPRPLAIRSGTQRRWLLLAASLNDIVPHMIIRSRCAKRLFNTIGT